MVCLCTVYRASCVAVPTLSRSVASTVAGTSVVVTIVDRTYRTRMTVSVIDVSTTADAFAASTSDGLTIVDREADRQLERARDSTPTS